MRNLKKEKRNIILGCLILAMFGCLNVAAYFLQESPSVYWNGQRFPVAINPKLEVNLEDFCRALALDYTIEGDKLLLGQSSQQVIELQPLLGNKSAPKNEKPLLVPIEGLCQQMGIPYTWDQNQQMIKLGDQTSNATEIPVLMYHHLLPNKDINGLFTDNNIVVSVEEFQAQMDFLKANGYQTISLSQLARYVQGEQLLPEKSVVITFDDGYLSNYTYAYPILKEAGFNAVIFLLTGFIEDTSQTFNPKAVQYLSWEQVHEMDDLFEYASHTNQMHRLGQNGRGVLSQASADEIVTDLRSSRQSLNNTPYFSYPYGHYSQVAINVLKQQGIQLAFTVTEGSVSIGDDPFLLPRWDVFRYRALASFEKIFS